ncbi:acetoacetate decarboxylase family protein [Mycolicibacillus trivialis]
MPRAELTGLPAIPETALSDALVATLPANDAPAPWECHCTGLVWLGRGGKAAAAALPSALRGSAGLVTVGGFVRYTDTPVGAYDEVLGIVGSRSGVRPWGHVAFMAVDSPASLVGGRTNWAMPKTLARFDGDPASAMTAAGADGDWRVHARVRPLGPAVPLRLTGTARQQFADGRVGHSRLVCSARVRPALVSVAVTSAGSLPQWLRPGRRLGAVLESARFTLAAPRFD